MFRTAAWLALPLLSVACDSGNPAAPNDDARRTKDAGMSVAVTDSGGSAIDSHDSGGDSAVGGGPPLGDCPTGPPSNWPSDSPRILVIAPTTSGAGSILRHLQGLFAGDASFKAPEIVLQLSDTYGHSLANFWYAPGGRDARLASLAQPFTWVVMLDDPGVALSSPELHFEGVRVVACRARAAGSKPILLQTWSSMAEDTDARGEIAYRVGNGTGTPVVPAGYAWSAARSGGAEDAGADSGTDAGSDSGPPAVPVSYDEGTFVAAASIYSAITGKSAASTTYQLANVTADVAAKWTASALDAVVTHAAISHYASPFASTVQLRTMPAEGQLWFMSSGTSSEALWYDRMNEIVPKLGMTPKGTAIGSCNDTKTFDAVCLDRAVSSFGAAQYQILFARDYSVSSATTVTAGAQSDLQVQVWDRHQDELPVDGAAAVEVLDLRSMSVSAVARQLGLAWLPYHLTFAKLKTARASVQLTSDGTHATYPVSYALATLSLVSRTSAHVPTDGLDADTAAGVGFAEETIRQLAALSQWGTYVADDPTTRPTVR